MEMTKFIKNKPEQGATVLNPNDWTFLSYYSLWILSPCAYAVTNMR